SSLRSERCGTPSRRYGCPSWSVHRAHIRKAGWTSLPSAPDGSDLEKASNFPRPTLSGFYPFPNPFLVSLRSPSRPTHHYHPSFCICIPPLSTWLRPLSRTSSPPWLPPHASGFKTPSGFFLSLPLLSFHRLLPSPSCLRPLPFISDPIVFFKSMRLGFFRRCGVGLPFLLEGSRGWMDGAAFGSILAGVVPLRYGGTAT
ncbi:hypothetical protein BDQ17DRAFT_1364890, partial [Cyathus striatus]